MAKRPYLDASTMRPMYEKYQRSGQSIKAFCKAEGINVPTFNYWRLKFIKAGQAPRAGFNQISVRPKGFSITPIILRLGNSLEIEFPSEYPVDRLSQLLTRLSC